MEKVFFVSENVKNQLLSGEFLDFRFSEWKNSLHDCRIKITYEAEKEITITEQEFDNAIKYSYEYNTINPELLKKELFGE